MVRVVGDHIGEQSGSVRAEALSPAIARRSRLQDRAESCLALLEPLRLRWRPRVRSRWSQMLLRLAAAFSRRKRR
jgi:hypothetical protein